MEFNLAFEGLSQSTVYVFSYQASRRQIPVDARELLSLTGRIKTSHIGETNSMH
jgi:hypothetical protein